MRLVGGCVRDILLGKTPTDVDIATPLHPEQVCDRLIAGGIRVIPTGMAFGTVTAQFPETKYEITSLRRDIETDGRHPRIAYTDSYQEDASRRDFTINALYQNREGILYDYHQGLQDLAQRHIRFIGDPEQRIHEDYLRILRYFRFWSSIENRQPDNQVLDAIYRQKEGLGRLSIERRCQELFKLLGTPQAEKALHIMEHLELLPLIAPHLSLPHFKGQTAVERFASMTVDQDLSFYKLSRHLTRQIQEEWQKFKKET